MPIIYPSQLFQRAPIPADANHSGGGIPVTYIVGFSIAGATFSCIAIWLGIFFYRKKRAQSRHNNLGSAFLSVRGIVNDDKLQNTQLRPNPTAFSRDNINSRVVFPSKSLLRGSSPDDEKAENEEIIEYDRLSAAFPKPFSFALRPPTSPTPRSPEPRALSGHSQSPSSLLSRFSVISAASSYNESLASVVTAGGSTSRSIRKVRQAFNPVLPDELLITPGEQLMILQSFDDGWCVVGRESGLLMPRPRSLFGGGANRASRSMTPTAISGFGADTGVGTSSGGNVELGMVPAWCFLKPVKGLRAERPVRSTSLGVTVQMDAPSKGRDETISWSNF